MKSADSRATFPFYRWLLVGLVLILLGWLWLGNSATRPQFEQLQQRVVDEDIIARSSERAPELLVLVGLSGGGTRAAALAYGVFEELAATRIVTSRGERRLLDEVDVISSVSGGSFINAYFGLFGDRLFRDFRDQMLLRTIEDDLVKELFNPSNWLDLASPYYGRNDLAADYFSQTLFDGKTFGDIDPATSPLIIINASDIGAGERFVFTRNFFKLLCIDFDSYSIARAVAASAAVPGVATPITLKNYAGQCGHEIPQQLRSHAQNLSQREFQAKAQVYLSYADVQERPWIHLVDGGITDNLGLRQFYTFFQFGSDLQGLMREFGHEGVSDVLMISVNAAVSRELAWAKQPEHPSEREVLGAMTATQMRNYTAETKRIVRETYGRWAEQTSIEDRSVGFNFIEVAFSAVADPEERKALYQLPTRMQLNEPQVDHLIDVGRRLLKKSPDFQRFVANYAPPAAALNSAPLTPNIAQSRDQTARE
jgi:NTE family protein